LAILLAPTSVADPTANLKSAIDSARGGCPRLQSDPILDEAARRENREVDAYIQHNARFIPFEDPLPIIRELGYETSRAKMIAGFADGEGKAIHGLLLDGNAVIPDCGYQKYGADALNNDGAGYVLTVAILAGA
jgi:hypothetical protein